MGGKQAFNVALSQKTAETINAKPKRCWSNAYHALIHIPELKKAQYVEGWIVRKSIPMPFEHGWLELDNEIIDPTRTLWKSEDAVSYFPGIVLPSKDIRNHISKASQLSIYRKFGNSGLSFPPYAKAFENALRALGVPAKDIQRFLQKVPTKKPEIIPH